MSNALSISKRLNIPWFVKDTFITFLRDFYSQDPDFTWDPDESVAKLEIHDRLTVNKEYVASKPAINVIRTPMRFSEIGVNQFKGWDLPKGENIFKDLMTGTMIFECLSRQGLEAEMLATTTMLAIQTFKSILWQRGIYKMQNITITEEQVVSSNSDFEIVKVNVVVPFHINVAWVVCEKATRFNGWDASIITFNHPTNPSQVESAVDLLLEDNNIALEIKTPSFQTFPFDP